MGVDREPMALEVARARAATAGLGQLRFVESDLRSLAFDEPFDAVVGRFVLMYVADPTDAVRSVSAHVRPGGVVAFQEFQFEDLMHSWPARPESLYGRTLYWVLETFRRAGVETNMGARLPLVFRDAGLGLAQAYVHCPLAAGAGHRAYTLFAHILESVLPLTESFGVGSSDEIDVATYAARLSGEMVADDSVACCAPVVGAWATTPAHRR